MRAKEYFEKYKKNPTQECLGEILKCFFDEIRELAEKRHAKTNGALISIILELEQKWKAFCRMVEPEENRFRELLEPIFRNALLEASPDLEELLTCKTG